MHTQPTMYASSDSVLRWIDDSRASNSGLRAAPPTVEAALGVHSELRLIVDAEGAVTGVFVPHLPTVKLGTRVVVNLTLGVITEPVSGLVAWAREAEGATVRCVAGLGITFPALSAAQRVLLQRGLLLHETTVVPPNATHVFELTFADDAANSDGADYELNPVDSNGLDG